MKKIELTNHLDQYIIVDDDDYEKFYNYRWTLNNYGYAIRTATNDEISNGYKRIIFLHREILGISKSTNIADHINHDKLDNRKNNLRICTKLENNKNVLKYTDREYTSKYKGVYWCKSVGLWRAGIVVDKKRVFIGYYKIEVHAAIAYNQYAIRHHGEFACLNEIPDEYKNEIPVKYKRVKKDKTVKREKSSKYFGVTFFKNRNNWQSLIVVNGKNIHIGYFYNEEDAAKAHDQIARLLNRNKLNFPNEEYDIINSEKIMAKIYRFDNDHAKA